jgi:hypothetical protein
MRCSRTNTIHSALNTVTQVTAFKCIKYVVLYVLVSNWGHPVNYEIKGVEFAKGYASNNIGNCNRMTETLCKFLKQSHFKHR